MPLYEFILQTPRRKKKKRESSDDSSSSYGFASSKERKREKPPSDDKKASSCDGEDDDIKFKHPIVDDDNKKQRSNESIDANPEKAVPPVGQDVSGDETMRCDDVEKHIDQNETEIGKNENYIEKFQACISLRLYKDRIYTVVCARKPKMAAIVHGSSFAVL
jgi:hypothetical protein